jgi:FkbM family methyltransferase
VIYTSRPSFLKRSLDYYRSYGLAAFLARLLQPWRWLAGGPSMREQLEQLVKESRRQTTYVGNDLLLTRTDFGYLMLLDARDLSLSLHIGATGSYEEYIGQTLISLLRPGMTFVDVGANIGYFSLLGAMIVGAGGRVVAYEPDPDICAILKKNFLLNSYRWGEARQAALTDKGGTGFLHRAENGSGWSTMIWPAFPAGMRDVSLEVPTATLDDDLAALGLSRVDVVKIDAQGSEGLIWNGMKATVRNNPQIAIICEFLPARIAASGVDPRRMLDEIRGVGLAIWDIGLDGSIQRVPDEELLTDMEYRYRNLLLKR